MLLISLSGCGTLEKFCRDAIITEKVVHVDARILEECRSIPLLQYNTFEAVLGNTMELTALYKECKNKQSDSAKLIKEFANIKDSK